MRLARHEFLHPQLQFRYTIFTSRLPGATIFAKSAQQPSFENNSIKLEHGNSNFKVKGKTNWNDLTLTCYQFEAVTVPMFWSYLQQHQITKTATDFRAKSYKHTLQITSLNPMGLPVGTWKLRGAFYNSVQFGEMGWGDEGIVEVTVALSYDYAEFELLPF